MSTVHPQFIDHHALRPGGPRPFGLPEAPVFRPTPEEFQNPLQYIQSIRPLAEPAGICKIIPPVSWRPEFAIDTENFFFRPRIQKLNFMEGKSRTTLNYLDQLQQFHQQNGVPMTRLPTLDRKPIDLFKLKKEVARRGGHEVVTETKKWAEVARAIGITGKTCTSMSHSIKTAFVKWVAPYEEYLAENGKLEGDPIEINPPANDNRDTKPPANDYHTRSKDEKKPADGDDSLPMPDVIPFASSSKDNVDVESKHRHGTRQQNGARPIQSYLKPGEFCEICLRSENEENLLLCDVCNNGFHTYCLTPPIIGVPKGEWYCINCLQKQGEDYGFEDGEERSLAEFQKMANEFKENWFITHRTTTGEVIVDENDVEMEFWRLVESPYEEIEVEYGADLHSSHHGSGFPTIEKHPFNPYSSCGWNLNNLPIHPDSLLPNVGSDIPGVMIPWLYVGMVFSTFCWHAEDHYQYSINYNHFGETKTWYGIPATHADRFEEVLKKTVPELFEINPDLLFHITTMISPATMVSYKVPCYAVDQRAGEFVITFPRAYHAGFNHGFNFCEAVNFAVPDWMPYGSLCIDRYREFRKPPVFSHDELVIATAKKNPDEQTALWLKLELERLRDRELGMRNEIRAKHPKLKEVVDNVEITNEDQAQCMYCSTFCTVTAVKCECNPNRVVCLHHTDLVFCQCKKPEKSTWIVRMRYTDDELRRIADIVSREAYKPNQWKRQFQQLMVNERHPPLNKLQHMLLEGQRIPNIQEDLKGLKDYIDVAHEWIERASNILYRKKRAPPEKAIGTSRRERKASQYANYNTDEEGYSAVSTASSRANIKHNIHAKEEKVEGRSLSIIQMLLKEIDSLGFGAAEVTGLKALEAEALAYQSKARALLAEEEDQPIKVYKDMIAEGKAMDIEVEELGGLVNKTRQADWAINADILIKTPNALFDIDRVINIMEEGKECGVKSDHPYMLHFKSERDAGTQWRQEATVLLKSKAMEYDQVQDLVERGKSSPVVPELLRHLQYELQRADDFKAWMEQYGGEGPQPTSEEEEAADVVRANIGDIKKLLKEYEDFPIRLEALPVLRQEVKNTDEWVGKTRKSMLSARVNTNTTPTQAPPSLQEYLDEIQNSIKACCNNVGTHDENGTPIFCICRLPENGIMVECDVCKEWYHIGCVKVPKKLAETSDEYTCPICDVTAPFPFGKRPTVESFQTASEEAGAFRFPPEEKDSLDVIIAMVTNWKVLVQDFTSRPMVAGPSDRFRAKQYLRAAEGMPVAVDEEAHQLRKKVVETTLHDTNAETNGGGGGEEDSENPDATYCVCKSKYDEERPMVQCDGCHDWFHLDCIGLSTAQADQMERYLCPICNPHQQGGVGKQKKREVEPPPKKIKLKINVPAATAAIAANDKKQKKKPVVADDPKNLYRTSSSDRKKRSTEHRHAAMTEQSTSKRRKGETSEAAEFYDSNGYGNQEQEQQQQQQQQSEADPQQVVAAMLLYYAQMGDQAPPQPDQPSQEGQTNGDAPPGLLSPSNGDGYQQQYPDWQYYQQQSS
ncbi:hypothetical protein SeLEV6574_g04654 [Synchytrium endobioticum]|nr:hypothetical protein SeLEV6574_g04654 [Synchytrium endobioticum]